MSTAIDHVSFVEQACSFSASLYECAGGTGDLWLSARAHAADEVKRHVRARTHTPSLSSQSAPHTQHLTVRAYGLRWRLLFETAPYFVERMTSST